MTAPLNSPECPLCRGGGVVKYLELPDRFGGDGELYHIYECRSCGIIFLYPPPPEDKMDKHYPDGEYDPFLETKGARSLSQKIYRLVKPWALNWKAKLVEKFHPGPGRILDVGAGTGAFLRRMAACGWEVIGVEKDKNAANFGREKWGLEIITGDLNEVENLPCPLDAVAFWHSLEHIHRMEENLRITRQSLSPDGFLFIALPNPNSLEAAVYGKYWVAWDAPRHLWHFKPEVLIKLLSDFGFFIRRIVPMPLDPFYNSLLSESLAPGSAWWKYTLRLPFVSISSYISGSIKPVKGSSVVYVASLK